MHNAPYCTAYYCVHPWVWYLEVANGEKLVMLALVCVAKARNTMFMAEALEVRHDKGGEVHLIGNRQTCCEFLHTTSQQQEVHRYSC